MPIGEEVGIHGGAHLGVHSFADWPVAGTVERSEGALDPTRIQSDADLEAFAELRGLCIPRSQKVKEIIIVQRTKGIHRKHSSEALPKKLT